MNRDELNDIYRKLENRMHKIVAPFISFLFSEDVDAEVIYKCIKFLRKEGFFY